MKRTTDDPFWTFAGATTEGSGLTAWPVNLWDYDWVNEARTVRLTEPHYREVRNLSVYSVALSTGAFLFAATEFTPGIYGFHFPKA